MRGCHSHDKWCLAKRLSGDELGPVRLDRLATGPSDDEPTLPRRKTLTRGDRARPSLPWRKLPGGISQHFGPETDSSCRGARWDCPA